MTTLELKALDTLFFRDGKPFSMGDETWATGIFPPFPSTVYGLLRSLYFADNLIELPKANGNGDPTENLELNGFLPTLNDQPAFPIPNDLYGFKREKNQAAKLLNYKKCGALGEFISEYNFDGILQTNETLKIQELGGKAFLTNETFQDYLDGNAGPFGFESLSDYSQDEHKIGIGREFNTRTSSEGKLYRVAMKRPEGEKGKLGFCLQFDFDKTLKNTGISRFGAESKAIEYGPGTFPAISNPVSSTDKFFKIYLATPAVFPEGAYPKAWFEDTGFKLLTAATGRTQNIGGFDYKKTYPKPMRKAVPAGTVYYIEVVDESKAKNFRQSLHQGSIYDLADSNDIYKKEYQKQGFGLTYLGKFKIQNA